MSCGWTTTTAPAAHRADRRGRARIPARPGQGADLARGRRPAARGGGIVAVVAAPEPLLEITCADARQLARVAWHLGNRHLAAEVGERVIHIRNDHVIADMVHGLGAEVRLVQRPFNPEGGAYAQGSRARPQSRSPRTSPSRWRPPPLARCGRLPLEGGGRNATGLARQRNAQFESPTGELSPMAFLVGVTGPRADGTPTRRATIT